MVTKRIWVARKTTYAGVNSRFYYVKREGWFLFGLLPVFIQDLTIRDPHNVLS